MKPIWKRLAVLLPVAVATAIVVPAMTAFGHAEYDHSTPNANEVVATPPTQIDAFFTQEVAAESGTYYVRVEDSSGTQVSEGDGTLNDDDRKLITATFPDTLANGQYIVRWKATSFEDGDSDEGAFCFYVVDQPTEEQTAACAALAEEEPTAAATGAETPGATPAATTAPTSEASPTATGTPDDEDDDDSNTGIIIGIIVVAIAAVVVVGGGIALYMRQRQ